MALAEARCVVGRAWQAGLTPDPNIGYDDWSDEYRYLPPDSSEPGRFRMSRTPYMAAILRDLSPGSDVEQVVLVKGGQIAGSETMNNAVGALMHLTPGRAMIVQPTVDRAKEYVRERINPLIEYTPVLKPLVPSAKSRDGSNTSRFKRFPGGFLAVEGANSASGLQSRAIRFLFLDEISKYPRDVDGQGDPVGMAIKRTDTFVRNRKIFMLSTPENKDSCRITVEYEETDQRKYYVPCPHCGHMDFLRKTRLKWPHGHPERAHMVCEGCGGEILNRHKTWMMDPANGAEWRATAVSKRPRLVGYHLPGLYSPVGWRTWEQIAAKWEHAQELAARGDDTILKEVVTMDLGEAYEQQGERATVHAIQARAQTETWGKRTVPRGGLIVTGAVDVQHNRLEVKAMAWGRDEEGWVVDYDVIYGDPLYPAVWDELDAWLQRPLTHECGSEMRIAACGIDASDGHTSEEVYRFVRGRTGRMVFALKGHKNFDAPILPPPLARTVNREGKKITTGDLLWQPGVSAIKNLMFARLKINEPGRNYVHFPAWLPAEYWPMLAAEKIVSRFINGQVYKKWICLPGERNEGWDLLVYNYAAAVRIGLNRWSAARWAECEALLYQGGLFTAPTEPAAQPAAALQSRAPASSSSTFTQPAAAPQPAQAQPAPAIAAPVRTADPPARRISRSAYFGAR